MSHNHIIKRISGNVSSLASQVTTKIEDNSDLFNEVNSEFSALVGEEEYDWYVEEFDKYSEEQEREELDNKPFYSLTDEEKKLKRYETSEAYVLLYMLCSVLKELQYGDVTYRRSQFGDGSINPSLVSEIIRLKDVYVSRAKALASGSAQGKSGLIWIHS